MLRRHASGLRALLMLTDGALAAATMVLTSFLRFGADWHVHWDPIVPDPVAFTTLYAVTWVSVLTLSGLYRPRARWSIRTEAVDLFRATLVMVAIVLAILFWFRLPDISRTYLLILFPAQFLVTLATRAAMRLAFRRMRARGLNQRFVLIVGAGPRAQAFAAKLESHRELGLAVIGFLDDEQDFDLPGSWRYRGRFADLENVLKSNVIDEVAVCLPFSRWDLVDPVVGIAEDFGKIVRVPMDVLDRSFTSGKVEELDGTPVFSLVSGPDRLLGLAAKRTLDLLGSAALLVVLSPLLGAIGIAIRMRDSSPILFRQTRVGLHGRPFDVAKFRTMATDAEARYAEVVAMSDPRAFKLLGDPRVTPLGRFLRRTSLDELPQLWNVLRGQMSLVGPRPAPPREVEGYDLWHRRRLSMKPGITGLWQVTARGHDDFDERAQLDLDYIDRWSLWLDLKILARTIPAAVEGR
jgi:exopolysaccharide biosynthesis polyprenyl glycosylphosphotransferase